MTPTINDLMPVDGWHVETPTMRATRRIDDLTDLWQELGIATGQCGQAATELLDAMPVHRVAVEDGVLREVYVIRDGDGFAEELRDPHRDVAAYFEALSLLPGEGCRAEVNLEAPRWIAAAAAALDRVGRL